MKTKIEIRKDKTPIWAILLVLICTLLVSVAQIFLKTGVTKANFSLISIATSPWVLMGILFYGIGGILIITALKGGEVTILFPIMTSSYIWVSLGSLFFLNETISIFRWSGIILIIAGILTMNIGDNLLGRRKKRWKHNYGQ